MNGGILSFSLGLTAGGFMNTLSRAQSKVGELGKSALSLPGLGTALGASIASISSLHAVIEGMFGAIQKGADLEYLSKRTSTSVASLYELQKGFKAVGLTADDVGPMIFKMQKALGGVNEMGMDTRSIFYQMGLSIEQLRQMRPEQQITAIGSALNRLDTTSAAAAAEGIFGRGGAGNIVQLAHSMGDFSGALSKAARDAQTFQDNAAAFQHLQVSLDSLKNKTNTLFAGMAAGAAPAIQAIVDRLNSIDLTGVGQQIGNIFTAFTEAFKEGKVAELIGLSITTGFQMGVAAAPAVFEKLGAFLLRVMETPLEYLQAGMTYVIEKSMEGFGKLEDIFTKIVNILSAGIEFGMQKLIEGLSKIPKLNKVLGIEGYKADSFQDILKGITGTGPKPERFKADSFSSILGDEKQNGLKFNVGSGDFGLDDIDKDAQQRWQEMKKHLKDLSTPLTQFIDGLVARAPKVKGAANNSGGAGYLAPMENNYKPEFTSLEKMGFVMGGHNNTIDYARRTAAATERIAAELTRQAPLTPPTLGGGLNLN